MNIWIISKYASSPKFGLPTRHYFLGKAFAVNNNHTVTMIGSRSLGFTDSTDVGWRNSKEFNLDGIKNVVLNGPIIQGGFSIKRIYSWIIFECRLLYWALCNRKNAPDVIIVSSLSLLTFLSGGWLKKFFKCKLVVEVRDIWPLTLQEMKGLSKGNIFIRLLSYVEEYGYRNANLIVGTMPGLHKHIADAYPQINKPVVNVSMGIDSAYFSTMQCIGHFKDYFKSINPHNYFTVGYAGTIGLVNNVNEIIEAALLLKDNPVCFVILGNGPEKEKLVKYCSEHELSNVFFHAAIPRTQVLDFVSHCNIMLNPIPAGNKVYKYGVSPNKWIDYMYAAKPILVSFDGTPSIINEANCGWFIQPGSPVVLAKKINELMSMDKEDLAAIGKRGKFYLEKELRYEHLAKKYLDFIENV